MQSSCAVATPTPNVGGGQTLQQVLTNDWRMFTPSLKLIAITVQNVCTIENDFSENAQSGSFSQIRSHIYTIFAQSDTADTIYFITQVCAAFINTSSCQRGNP